MISMRKFSSVLFLILIPLAAFAANEDFTSWDPGETDEDGDITVTASKIDISSMRRDALSYVIDDKGAGHFTTFTHEFGMYITDGGDTYGNWAPWVITNQTNPCIEDIRTANDGILVGAYDQAGGYITARLEDTVEDNSDDYPDFLDSGVYVHVEVTRSGSATQAVLYEDDGGSAGDEIVTLSVTYNSTAYRYIAVSNRHSATAAAYTATGYVKNMNLNESTPPAARRMFFVQ